MNALHISTFYDFNESRGRQGSGIILLKPTLLICSAINPRVVSKAKRNDALSGSNVKLLLTSSRLYTARFLGELNAYNHNSNSPDAATKEMSSGLDTSLEKKIISC